MHCKLRAATLLAVITAFSSAAGLAQSTGQAIYKEKCMNCHGPSGLADGSVGKLLRVKPISDLEVKKLTEAEMIQMVRLGSGKMQSYKGELADAQIKAAVDYLRSLAK